MDKLNILQIYDYMELGGAESHIITLSKALINRGHKVQIASSYGPSVAKLNEIGIKFHNLNLYDQSQYIKNAGKIIEIMEKENIDIVHVHPFHSQIIMCIVKLIKKIPTITTIHGAYKTPSVNGLQDFFDGFILISEESKEFHLNKKLISREVIEVIPNSVPLIQTEKPRLNNDILKIAYVSRIDNDKLPSLLFLIKCVERVLEFLNVEITIIGQGTKYDDVVELIHTINKKVNRKAIRIINGSTDIIKFLQAADIVVGVGRVILEALSVNRIPICIGNNYYVGIIKKENLLRISEVNFTDRNSHQNLSSEAFVKDLLRIKNEPEQVLREQDESFQLFKRNFDVATSAERHEDLYKKIMTEYKQKIFTVTDILKSNPKINELDSLSFAFELKENGLHYKLDNPKDTRILLVPDFFNENDCWSKVLVNLMKDHHYRDMATLIIRVENSYIEKVDEIILNIQQVLIPFENKNMIDILIDCEYQDEATSILFLSEINHFIPTNENQHDTIFKCKLLGKQIIEPGSLK